MKLTPPPPVDQRKAQVKPPIRMPSFLASACSFQRPVVTSTASTLKQTPQEELKNELKQYLGFEAAPTEGVGGLSVEEMLMNPLLWWKVSMSPTMQSCIPDNPYTTRYMLHNSLPSLAWPETISQSQPLVSL